MKKILLSAGLICTSFIANAQCTATTTLNETFENFSNGALPQNCWTTNVLPPSPKATIATVSESKVIQLYSFMTPTEPWFVVSPEISTIDGNHELSFELKPVAGTMTVQVGTMATPTDYANFANVGSPITVSPGQTTFSNIVIPASTTQKHIAFRAVATAPHMVSSLDNISWQPTLSVNDSKLPTFNVYPNPATDRNITVAFNSTIEKANIAIYNLTGSKVFETETANNADATNLNLSGLSSGIYLLKIQSGNDTATKKLILK